MAALCPSVGLSLFGFNLKSKFILLFSLFFLLIINLTVHFSTIYEFYYTILTNFYLYIYSNFNKNISVSLISNGWELDSLL